MFPLRDHNPSQQPPYVTWTFIALNVTAYLLTAPWALNLQALWAQGALWPVAISQGVYLHGLITHMFLHAGLLHLAGNMLFLWVFGDNLEEQLGHLGFAAVYLACGLIAALAQIAQDPGATIPMVGASGAVAGVMGGYMLLFPRARVDLLLVLFVFFKILTVPAWLVLGLWFALQLVNEAMSDGLGGVAHMAHIGGFLAGLVLTLPLWLRRGGPGFWSRTEGHPPHPSITYSRTHIPVVRRRR